MNVFGVLSLSSARMPGNRARQATQAARVKERRKRTTRDPLEIAKNGTGASRAGRGGDHTGAGENRLGVRQRVWPDAGGKPASARPAHAWRLDAADQDRVSRYCASSLARSGNRPDPDAVKVADV